MKNKGMHEEIFMKKPFIIEYDGYNLEVSVRKLSKEHSVKCTGKINPDDI